MGTENQGITAEIPEITLSYLAGMLESLNINVAAAYGKLEDLEKRLDHIDEYAHDIERDANGIAKSLTAIGAQVDAIHAEVEAAKPLIEKAQRSMLRKLAAGQMPWT